MIVYVCVCVRFALCMSAIDSLQTHIHMRACAHTHTYRRWWEERHTEKVGGRTTVKKRERRSPYIILAHKMVVMLSVRYMTVGGQIYSRISFRSDDDNDDVPWSSISPQLRRYDFFFLYICHWLLVLLPSFFSFFLSRYNSDYNSYRFLLPIYKCVCISRDRENVPCFIAIDGRSSARVYVCMCVWVHHRHQIRSDGERERTRREQEQEKEIHACMKARRRLIINSSMPLVEFGWVRREEQRSI